MSAQRSPLSEVLRFALPILIILVGLGGFTLLWALKGEPQEAPGSDDRIPVVNTSTVENHLGGLDIEVSGLVVHYREIPVPTEVAGRIDHKEALCEEGKYVEQGTPLIQIDNRDFQFELDRLAKELRQAEIAVDELDDEIQAMEHQEKGLLILAQQQVDLYNQEFQRLQRLGRTVAQNELNRTRRELLVAEKDYQTLRSQYQVLKTRKSRMQAAIDLAKSKQAKAQLDYDRTSIKAPVSGVIVSDDVEEDEFVQRGAVLFTIEDTSKVEVLCNLQKNQARWIWLSQPQKPGLADSDDPRADYELPTMDATVTFKMANVQYSWKAKLSRYDGIGFDDATRTIPCRVTIDQPRNVKVSGRTELSVASSGPRALVRGMYVTVKIHTTPRVALLRLPRRALHPGKVVWVVKNGRLEKPGVDVVEFMDKEVVINAAPASIKAGDRVVVSPLSYPRDGQPVREETAP